MTEHEWLTCTDPEALLQSLYGKDGVSDRKYRLFACACVRESEEHLRDPRAMCALLEAERHCDSVDFDAIAKAKESSNLAWRDSVVNSPIEVQTAILEASGCCNKDASYIASFVIGEWKIRPGEIECDLLRDIVPNPFRVVTLDSRHVSAQCLDLAHGAYEHRLEKGRLDTFRLALLADALEEAGCPAEVECQCENSRIVEPRGPGGQMIQHWCPDCRNTERRCHHLLAHLRSPGPHVRGCWALDLVLGKE